MFYPINKELLLFYCRMKGGVLIHQGPLTGWLPAPLPAQLMTIHLYSPASSILTLSILNPHFDGDSFILSVTCRLRSCRLRSLKNQWMEIPVSGETQEKVTDLFVLTAVSMIRMKGSVKKQNGTNNLSESSFSPTLLNTLKKPPRGRS